MEASGTGLRAGQLPAAAQHSQKESCPIAWRLRSHWAAEHSQRQRHSERHSRWTRLAVVADRVSTQTNVDLQIDSNQELRDGHYEAPLVQQQVRC